MQTSIFQVLQGPHNWEGYAKWYIIKKCHCKAGIIWMSNVRTKLIHNKPQRRIFLITIYILFINLATGIMTLENLQQCLLKSDNNSFDYVTISLTTGVDPDWFLPSYRNQSLFYDFNIKLFLEWLQSKFHSFSLENTTLKNKVFCVFHQYSHTMGVSN